MLFSEPTFLFLFLPVVLLLYAVLPRGWRNGLLTAASLLFYAAGEARFVPWLLASVVVNYYFALWIERWRGKPGARAILILGVASDLGLLLYFKYANFLLGGAGWLLAHLHLPARAWANAMEITLPLGISFFTFHKISYKVDVFRGHVAAKRNPFDLALYILFFPQLIAGPIVRYNEVAHQFGADARRLDGERLLRGMRWFMIGLSKKMLVANIVAAPADAIFALKPSEMPPSVAWLGIVCYSLQIYFDFSGYSDMAVGLAAMFGFDFPANFRYPYWAQSVTDFWRRWHISLSTWFRDYLYIPLGGNRVSRVRGLVNLLLVFLLCGLWHGAAWSFVCWGLFHGFFLIVERLGLGRGLAVIPRVGRHVYLLLVVMAGWVFFRAPTLEYAWKFFGALAGVGKKAGPDFHLALYLDRHVALALVIGVIGATPWAAELAERLVATRLATTTRWLAPAAGWCAAVVLAGCFLLSLMAVVAGTYNPFIYFRF